MARGRRRRTTSVAADEVMVRSAHRCCICFTLNPGGSTATKGQLAHVDRNPRNSDSSNLAFLCGPHHDEYDSGTSQMKGWSPSELRMRRDLLYQEMAKRLVGIEAMASWIEERRSAVRGGASEPVDLRDPGSSRTPCARAVSAEDYRRLLLSHGQPLELTSATSRRLLRFLAEDGDGVVQRVVDFGLFTDGERQVLMVPPVQAVLAALASALEVLGTRRGALRSEAIRLATELREACRTR